MNKRLLLINPWIHDFAAFDFWAKPLGLQLVASALINSGFTVDYLDLTDPLSPWLSDEYKSKRKRKGTGRFHREPIDANQKLPNINRRFSRYGLPPQKFKEALQQLPKPDTILVTSMMTYWYPGVIETISHLKKHWDSPVVLGGVYATLCKEHAVKHSGADYVLAGTIEDNLPEIARISGADYTGEFIETPLPAYQLASHADSAALLTSRGCPNRCPYCAVNLLQDKYIEYEDNAVMEMMRQIVSLKIKNIALFDDAFLHKKERALRLLNLISTEFKGVRFHGASGMACRNLTKDVAQAMKQAGFETIRLGLETIDTVSQKKLGAKVTRTEFENAVENLLGAGIRHESIGAYVLVGLPNQKMSEVKRSVDAVLQMKIRPHLAEFSPVPGSPFYEEAKKLSQYDLEDPIFQNPTLLPLASEKINPQSLDELKHYISAKMVEIRSTYF